MILELILVILIIATLSAGAVVVYRAYAKGQKVRRSREAFAEIQLAAREETQTVWTDRWIIIVQEEFIDSANAQMSPIDPDTGGDRTFGSVRLSPDGQEKMTHTGCNTAATEQMTQGIFTAFDHAPWAEIYDAHEWTWDDVLADMGLQVIESEEI